MSNTKKWILLLAAAGIGLVSWSTMRSEPDAERFANQLWIDRMPKHDRDMIHYFVALDVDRQRVGAAGKASTWRQFSDLFLWSREDDRLSLYFGQEQALWKPQVKVWRCEGGAPAGFDLCMKMWDERHTVLLYSRDEWRVEGRDDDATKLPVFAASLPLPRPDADAAVVAGPASGGEPRFLSW